MALVHPLSLGIQYLVFAIRIELDFGRVGVTKHSSTVMKYPLCFWHGLMVFLLCGAGCQVPSVTSEPSARQAAVLGKSESSSSDAFLPGHLIRLDQAVEKAIDQKKLPGGVLWFQQGQRGYRQVYGHRSAQPKIESITEETLFDAASLTKVIATAPSIMKLVQSGDLSLEAPVSQYLPEFASNGKEAVTVRQLMTHTSGLRPGLSLKEPWSGVEGAIQQACAESLQSAPDTAFKYSDINYIVLGVLVQRVSGKSLDQFAKEHLFDPLGMEHTCFLPPSSWHPRTAPTTEVDGAFLRGVVHDPTSRRMGGVAGHAGLFTCTADLARFARMMLAKGSLDGTQIFKPETVALMTAIHTPAEMKDKRALGWDVDTAYSSPRGYHFPLGSYGHTGWTGTSIWIVPQSEAFLIFLSNRNHPTEDGSVVALRRTLATIAAESIPAENHASTSGKVLQGIDQLLEERWGRLRGMKVGLITNHTGHTRDRTSTIDWMHRSDRVSLVSLFSPEHGIRGELDEKVADGVDTQTGLTIHSLYGEHRQPLPKQLEGLDALVFDIQDIGSRYYTYISTMGLAMEAAAEAGIAFVVLDRINPIGGVEVEGPVLMGEEDFVGFHPIPIRHGMTVGELALLFQKEKNLALDLQIVPVRHWSRGDVFETTGQPWTSPSPNMRNVKEAFLYPGIGILETTNLSVGRGTDTPFELLGAPYIDDLVFVAALNRLHLPGVAFSPIAFTPNASVFKEQRCQGVYISITDRSVLRQVALGVQIAHTLKRLYPDQWDTEGLNRLLRHPPTRDGIEQGAPLEEIFQSWQADLEAFRQRRASVLLY